MPMVGRWAPPRLVFVGALLATPAFTGSALADEAPPAAPAPPAPPAPPASAIPSVDLLDLQAVNRRVQTLTPVVAQRREALAALRERLAKVEEEVPKPEPPADLPTPGPGGEVGPEPTVPSLDDVLGGAGPWTDAELAKAEGDRKARHAEAMATWQRRKAERAQAVAAHAEAVRAHEAASAQWPAQVKEARERLAGQADEDRAELDAADRERRQLRAIAEFLEKTPPAGRTALRALRRAGEFERGRVAEVSSLDEDIRNLQRRARVLADRAATGGLIGLVVDQEAVDRGARRVADHGEGQRTELAAVAGRLEELGGRLDARFQRLHREVLLSLDTPGIQERIDGLYSARIDAERRARRTLRGRRPGQGPSHEDTAEALREAVRQPDGLSSAGEALRTVSGAEASLGRLHAHLDEQDLAMAWRELAFDRQFAAALAPHISEELRTQLHGVGLHVRWLADARLEILDASAGFVAWASRRWDSIRNPSMPREAAERLAWIVAALLLFVVLRRTRSPLQALTRSAVRAIVTAPSLRSVAGTTVRWSVLVEAVIDPVVTLLAGLAAFELTGQELPELVFARAVFVWWAAYLLGAAAVVGLTTPAGLGRPPLLPADAETSELLATTYSRIGLPVVVTGIFDELARAWLFGGVLSSVVRSALWLLMAAWALWSLVAWRSRLGRWWLECAPADSLEHRIAGWYSETSLGALLSPAVMVRLLLDRAWRSLRGLLSAGGALAWLQSRRLAREARQRAPEAAERRTATLPPDYRQAFRADIDIQAQGALPPSRTKVLEQLHEVVDRWERDPGPGAVVLTAESGMGKTVVLDHLQAALSERLTVHRARLTEKLLRPEDLAEMLAPELQLGPGLDMEALAEALDDGEQRVVVVDDIHHLFLRTVGGYDAFDALVRLVVASGDGTFWVLALGEYAWEFLSRRHPGEHHFDDVVRLPPLAPEELEDLITRRHETTGFEIEFDEVIHSGSVGAAATDAGLRLVESVDGFFLLLSDASGGNPDIAQRLWLDALTTGDDGTLRVGLFPSPGDERLRDAGDQALFTLAAFILHETLTTNELATVTNIGRGEAEAAVERLRGWGVLAQEVDEPRGRLTVSPRWYRPTIRLLRRKHLL